MKYISRISLPQALLSYFLPGKVMTGIFAGMKYVNSSVESVILPKLVGTYEDELNNVFEKIKNNPYDSFIDIGAAEGYYAVGIKKYLLPGTKKALAFEASAKGRKQIRKLAKKNNVAGIDIKGICNRNDLLLELNQQATFILVDIEGGEFELLDTAAIDFSHCDLLIEVHYKGRENELLKKFESTHHYTLIERGQKRLPEKVAWHPLIRKYSGYVVNEFRKTPVWLFLESKKNSENKQVAAA